MIVLTVSRDVPADTLRAIVRAAEKHPGGHRLRVIATTGPEPRTVTLGPRWSVSASARCLDALSRYGEVDEC